MKMLYSLSGFALFLLLFFSASCGEKSQVVQQQNSGAFNQEFSPRYLDVLWVIDDRSPLWTTRTDLTTRAEAFFKLLAQKSEGLNYRMGFITPDMDYAKGRLKPLSNPIVLTGSIGQVNQRAALFASILTQFPINLHTSAENRGFEAAQVALTQYFKSATDVPLVIIFISDTDDHSSFPDTETSAVEHYSKFFLSLKKRSDLVRVYSINYEKLKPGDDAQAMRCATETNAEIDNDPNFQDRYFEIARKLGGKTANLCSGTWPQDINLDGLRLKELERRFKLDQAARPDSIIVRIMKDGKEQEVPHWTYDAATQEIVFDVAPIEGGKVTVSYSFQ
jgi:hypothetical protein